MAPQTRRPPCILFLHDGDDVKHFVQYLTAAGLRVVAGQEDQNPVEAVVAADPDIIVLDFAHDGDTVTQLKKDSRTRKIPVIALADLAEIARVSGGEDGGTA